jgi:hypothetical protein
MITLLDTGNPDLRIQTAHLEGRPTRPPPKAYLNMDRMQAYVRLSRRRALDDGFRAPSPLLSNRLIPPTYRGRILSYFQTIVNGSTKGTAR